MSKKWIVGAGIAILALGLLAGGGYAYGRYYFKDHFYPKTSINGVDVSLKTGEEALFLVKDELAQYSLGIFSEENTMTINSIQSGLEYTGTDEVAKMLEEQDEVNWWKEVLGEHKKEGMGIKVDEEKLQATVNELPCMTPTEPRQSTDARIEYSEAEKTFVVIDETIGNIVDQPKFYQAVKDAILAGESIVDLKTNEYYIQPKYFAKDKVVTDAKAELDRYLTTVIHYKDFDLTYDLDQENIHKFIQVSNDFKITFDKEMMKDFIQTNISPVFNTVGTQRKFNTPGSGEFVASGGTYGWQVGLIDERTAMIENIKAGGEVTREPQYLQDAKVKDRDNDIGDTYVDVNISMQKLWVVDKGKVVMESNFVSGDASKGRDTDKGIFQVERNERNYHMKDYNVTVSYWMPFNLDQGEGFHDASWRKHFGGDTYMGNGSHGCVNLPPDVAKKMFGIVSKGWPVIVH